jgi:hypothetical protein
MIEHVFSDAQTVWAGVGNIEKGADRLRGGMQFKHRAPVTIQNLFQTNRHVAALLWRAPALS